MKINGNVVPRAPKSAEKLFFFEKLLKNINKYKKLWKFAENLDKTQNWNFIFLHLAPTGPWDPSKYP